MVSQQNKSVGVWERKRAQQNAFDKREDCGGRADAQGQSEDDSECERRCSSQLPKCETQILY